MKPTQAGALVEIRGGVAFLDQAGGRLPADVIDEALRRLTGMACVVAVLLTIETIVHITATRLSDRIPLPTAALVARCLAVIDAVALYYIVRHTNLSPRLKLDIGLLYEILGGLAIVTTEMVMVTAFEFPLGGTSVLAIWLLLWRLIVPTPPGRAAFTAFGTAAMMPLGIWISEQSGFEIDDLISNTLVVTTFLTAAIAWAASRTIYRMGEAVGEARQLGSYRLESLLGHGGMGEVWRASHRLLKRPAAIKLVRPEILGPERSAQHATAIARFETEAQTTANLQSPHTVQLFDFGSTDDGSFYYVMELLEGLDLETMVSRFGPLSADRVVYFLDQVCHSLADAHSHSMIHRDIKPANLFVCRLGPEHDFLKVLDFGLVKSTKQKEDSKLTGENLTTGTPAYMAPELALGQAVTPMTDFYMLGCVAYWMLTGRLVFEADVPIMMVSAHIRDEPTPVSQRTEIEVPAELESLIMDCLEKDPAARPASADEVRRRLRAIPLATPWDPDRARQWWARHHPERAEAAA